MSDYGIIPSPQFVMVRFSLLDSKAWDQMDPRAIKLYLKQRRYIWRVEDRGKLAPYYSEGWLVTDGFLSQWAKWLGVSKPTVSRILGDLESAGWIRWLHKSSAGGDPNVVAFGRWHLVEGTEEKVEIYFLDVLTVSEMKQSVSGEEQSVSGEKQTVSGVKPSNREPNIEGNKEPNHEEVHNEPEICPDCGKPRKTDGTNTIKDLCTCLGESELAAAFGERPYTPEMLERFDPTPAQAGGAHGPADTVIDGICRFNGMSSGIDGLSKKDLKAWRRQVVEIVEAYKVNSTQASLAWMAYRLRFSYKAAVSPFYASFASEIGPLLAQARDGDITEVSLAEEELGGNGKRPPAGQGDGYRAPSQEQIEIDRALMEQKRKEKAARP